MRALTGPRTVAQAGYNTFTMANGNIALTIRDGRIVSVFDKAHEHVSDLALQKNGHMTCADHHAERSSSPRVKPVVWSSWKTTPTTGSKSLL